MTPRAGRTVMAPHGCIPQHLSQKDRMRRALRTKTGPGRSRRRQYSVEPAIGYLKAVQGCRPFLLRRLAKGEPEWRFPCAVANLARILLEEPSDDPRPAGPVGLGSVAPPPRLSAAPRRLDGLRRSRPQARIPTRPVRHPAPPAQSGRPALCRPGRGVRPAPRPGRLAPSRGPPSRRSETQRPRLGAGFLTEGVLLAMPA